MRFTKEEYLRGRARVYLAGPITGLSYHGATDWRDGVSLELHRHGVLCYSPMRGKEYLHGEDEIKDQYLGTLLSSAGSITARDRNDTMRADLVIANLAGAERVSIGTVLEVAWADAFRVPVIVVEEDGGLHDHSMLRTIAGWWVHDLDSAVKVARQVLLP